MRTKLFAANWKMHKTVAETVAFARELAPLVKDVREVEIAIAPPFTALDALRTALGVAEDHVAAAELGEHGDRDLAGEGALGFEVRVLRG